MSVGMNNMMGAAFFSTAFSNSAQRVQSTPLNQLQSLQGIFNNLFQAASQFSSGMMGRMGGPAGFAQSPVNSRGFMPGPGSDMMTPINPGSANGGTMGTSGMATRGGVGGSAFAGGFVFVGGMGTIGTQPPRPKGITTSKDGTITTPGGYKVKAEGKANAWTITSPEGKTTRIWGDPHVHEADGGKWDFKKDMSFVLPDGTKIKCNTTKPKDPNAPTVTKDIHVMHGNQRASISGIEKNKPTTPTMTNDRYAFDARDKDGAYAVLGKDGTDWYLNGKNEITGGNMRTGEIFVKGENANRNLMTGASRGAMSESGIPGMGDRQFPGMGRPGMPGMALAQRPRFGGQQFMQMMMQQMFQRMMMTMMNPMSMMNPMMMR